MSGLMIWWDTYLADREKERKSMKGHERAKLEGGGSANHKLIRGT